MMRKRLYAAIAALLVTLLLAAPAGAEPPVLPGMDEMMQQMERDLMELRGLRGRDFEVAYMQMMRSHHMAAVEMAQLVPTRATHPELKTLAQAIIADQQREIAELEGWLKAWYGIDTPMDMPMAGMDKMMQALMGMSGADFEQGWLLMMVHHHQGAVDMSALAHGRATHPELLAFAQRVIDAQTQEIAQMREWAMAWYGFDPMPTSHGGHGGSPMPGLPNTGAGGQAGSALGGPAVAIAALLGLAMATVLLRHRLER
jgi:uncharacterized protein (DUF305 family)